MKKSRFNQGNFINNMSFQRAQGKIDTFYPHCYSLGLTLGNFTNNMSFQRAQGKIDTFYPHCYSLAAIPRVDRGLIRRDNT